jgi:hypothetical protein
MDKSKVPCLGLGTVIFTLNNKNIILHDILHVPKLRSPLLSVRCFYQLSRCSFIADNTGSFLTFPRFFLHVDDSPDCTIPRTLCSTTANIHFDSHLVGIAANVSDNTRNRHLGRIPQTSSSTSSKQSVPQITSENTHPTIPRKSSLPTNTTVNSSSLPTITEDSPY